MICSSSLLNFSLSLYLKDTQYIANTTQTPSAAKKLTRHITIVYIQHRIIV